MNTLAYKTRQRLSGVELLKIAAMFMIVISHVVQTLHSENSLIPYDDYIVDLTHATRDIQQFTLTIFRYFGNIGNLIFFVCSAWFLLEKKSKDNGKIYSMLTEIWMVSVTILIISLILVGGGVK
ncbi:MAG: hypothetical protein LUC22_01795 [Prevotella sp.]|nr:hypothetical protein [Prevotella sp.]